MGGYKFKIFTGVLCWSLSDVKFAVGYFTALVGRVFQMYWTSFSEVNFPFARKVLWKPFDSYLSILSSVGAGCSHF